MEQRASLNQMGLMRQDDYVTLKEAHSGRSRLKRAASR
jgi:hypothetical protein